MIVKVEPILVSYPVTARLPAPGSIVDRCTACHQFVWLSPASQTIVELEHPPVYCMDCVAPILEEKERQGEEISFEWTRDAVQYLRRGN
jgi:hypothetical protein